MQMTIEALRELLARVAGRYVTATEATYFAYRYVENHLKKAPRYNLIAEAVADLKVWWRLAGTKMETVVDQGAVQVLNFNGLAPSLKIKQIHDELEQRARNSGIAALGFHNSAGIMTLGMWTDGLAERDIIGIGMFNGGVERCVPFGGARGLLGTNPLAYAIPTTDRPLTLDMATTEIAYLDAVQAKSDGRTLSPRAALDERGRPTTDAARAVNDDGIANLLPMGGGFKGYGLVMLIEILTGSLVRSLLSSRQTPGWNPTEYGCLLVAMDPSVFTDLDAFKSGIAELCQRIRQEPVAEGSDGVAIPGDRSHVRLTAALQQGVVDIDPKLVMDLERLAEGISV